MLDDLVKGHFPRGSLVDFESEIAQKLPSRGFSYGDIRYGLLSHLLIPS